MGKGLWEVLVVTEVDEWFTSLVVADPQTAALVEDAVDNIVEYGPSLGRPLVDTVAGSRVHNMKELRPGSTGRSEVRILLVFDPKRRAILLVAGGQSRGLARMVREEYPDSGRTLRRASSRVGDEEYR